MRNKILAFLLLAVGLCARGSLVTYPAGPGVETTDDYTVRVRELPSGAWHDVSVYPVKVDQVVGTNHKVRTASMACFDFDGKVEVEVVPRYGKVETARIRPLSYGLEGRLCGDTLTFTLEEPRNLSVEFDGNIFRNLHLFANPTDTHRPTGKQIKKDRNLIYFAPGLHELPDDSMYVASGSTVYIDGGAMIRGTIVADGVENVKFYGRGMVFPEPRGYGIEIRNSRGIEVEGIILSQLPVGGSDGVKVSNVKSISSYGWGDGMNVFASNNVEYDRVFCRNSDDCSTVYATRKGYAGGCRNITMKNSTLWADVAHPVMIGLHGSAKEIGPEATPDTISDVRYENIDILDHAERQLDYQGCMAINCGDNNIVKDIIFDNIRVEDFRQGQLFNIRIFYNQKYCAAPGTVIEDILFKDINYNGHNSEISIISGYSDDRPVRNIVFDNLVVNGVRISDDMPGKPRWYRTGDMARIFVGEHVEGVEFR